MIVKLLVALAVAYGGWWLWRMPIVTHRKAAPPPMPPHMPAQSAEAAARELLGVGAGAGSDEIRAAHRRLIARVHPDHGGTAELTRRVNDARDLLIKRLSS